jgi:hypothetical protein
VKKLSIILLCLVITTTLAIGQVKPVASQQLEGFKELLSGINGSFTLPDNFTEVKPPNSDKLPFQYGLKFPDDETVVWFQVNSVKAEWLRYEKNGKQGLNPDSAYIKTASDEANSMASTKYILSRSMPQRILDAYNADEGRSYLVSLADMPETKGFQYALLIVLHKNHYGNIVVACLTNERGPAFFRNINKLRYCFKFNG